ncbi:MAG: ABC transporter ATP-binding protein [Treponema sp.]|nr:ABC transporter ATP-binding protein [Treponema sp.]MCI5519465.1 ABC transporter ATP-binding protein [Treponema sp.]MCI6891182.1 ABC transporter ATP-binding protein [Treponema sp.]MCI7567641.1 ABC transporter ATP-binding protein [Treponema sp.]
MSNILEIENLEKKYISESESLTVLKDLNLTVESGKKVVIVGESGSGKSTLLNIIGGIDKASSGTVRAGKWILNELSEAQLSEYRSKYLGLVFQFHYLLKDFTALENVAMPALIAGMPKKEAYERAGQLLQDVGVYERKDHLQSQLSGGERQRVAVARSLINNPQLLLADEPTGNLDPANAEKIGQLLFSIVDKYSKTLILVTHDMNLASKGDFQYRIVEGKLQ